MNHLKEEAHVPVKVTAAKAYASLLDIIVVGDKEVAKFVTPSGVTGIVATSVTAELLTRLGRRLEGKLRRSGHLTDVPTAQSRKQNVVES